VAVASAGPHACLHLAPDRQPHQHPTTLVVLQAGCPSCRPTNSVKALKANADEITMHVNNINDIACTTKKTTVCNSHICY